MARLLVLVAAGLVLGCPAFAHTGVGETVGFAHGFVHPVGGLDHLLTMVAVGLFAAQLGGRGLWLVPLAFVTMMGVGGALGMHGVPLPLTELGIGLSIVALGLAVAFGLDMPVAAAMAFVGFFAIFHGHAHGAEMPVSASGLEYGSGFVLATVLLHACGIGLGLALRSLPRRRAEPVTQVAGAAMALAGIAVLSR